MSDLHDAARRAARLMRAAASGMVGTLAERQLADAADALERAVEGEHPPACPICGPGVVRVDGRTTRHYSCTVEGGLIRRLGEALADGGATRSRARTAGRVLIERIGAAGPQGVDVTAERAAAEIDRLRAEVLRLTAEPPTQDHPAYDAMISRLDVIWASLPGDPDYPERQALVAAITVYEDLTEDFPAPTPEVAARFRAAQDGEG